MIETESRGSKCRRFYEVLEHAPASALEVLLELVAAFEAEDLERARDIEADIRARWLLSQAGLCPPRQAED